MLFLSPEMLLPPPAPLSLALLTQQTKIILVSLGFSCSFWRVQIRWKLYSYPSLDNVEVSLLGYGCGAIGAGLGYDQPQRVDWANRMAGVPAMEC